MGHLSECSILGMQSGSEMQLGLDWAIVELSENAILDARSSRMKTKTLKNIALSGRIIPKLEKAANIVAYTGYNGVIKGTISPSITMMRLSPRSSFQGVWTVRLDSPLTQGDSGSWVVDAHTGHLYGHIVAGVAPAGANIAYVIPAWKIFEDISRVMGPIELFANVIAQGVGGGPSEQLQLEEVAEMPERPEKGKAVSFVIDDHYEREVASPSIPFRNDEEARPTFRSDQGGDNIK